MEIQASRAQRTDLSNYFYNKLSFPIDKKVFAVVGFIFACFIVYKLYFRSNSISKEVNVDICSNTITRKVKEGIRKQYMDLYPMLKRQVDQNRFVYFTSTKFDKRDPSSFKVGVLSVVDKDYRRRFNPKAFADRRVGNTDAIWSFFQGFSHNTAHLIPATNFQACHLKHFINQYGEDGYKQLVERIIESMEKLCGDYSSMYRDERKCFDYKDGFFVTTHGFSVAYLHVRFEAKVKYPYLVYKEKESVKNYSELRQLKQKVKPKYYSPALRDSRSNDHKWVKV